MRQLERRHRKRKRHHEPFVFLMTNGELRISASCRGGWRYPTPLERACYPARIKWVSDVRGSTC
jgi:hypothetical protein